MPKVERVTGPSVGVQSVGNISQNVRPSAGAFGAGLGKGLSDMARAQAEIQEKDDQAAVKQATSALRKRINQRTYLDEDSYYNRQGQDAYKSLAQFQRELDDARKDVARSLTRGKQQNLFNQVSQDYLDREYDSMARHASKGRKQWLDGQDLAIAEQAQEDGSLRWNDNAEYAIQIRKSVGNLAKRNGWSPEKRELEVEKQLTGMHKQAIDNILEQNPMQAEEYFRDNKEEISSSIHDDIQRAINQQVDSRWSQSTADAIRISGGSRSERFAMVNEIDDPERRKLVRAQVEYDLRQEKIAKEESQVEWYDEASKAVMGGTSATQWAADNPEAWDSLDASMQKTLLNPKHTAINTDLATYYEIRGLMTTDKDAAREKLLKSFGKLSASDAKGFMDELAKPTKDKRKSFLSNPAVFNRSIQTILGKEPSKEGQAKREWNKRYQILAGVFQDELDRWFDANPGKTAIPDQDRQEILDRMAIQTTIEDAGFLWFDAEGGLGDIPVEDLEQIRAVIRARGEPMSPENIMRYYNNE